MSNQPHRVGPALDETSWTGVAFGLALAALAAYQLFKLPPVMPLLLARYGYGRVLAGGFVSVFALSGLLLSMGVGRGLERRGVGPYLAAAFILFVGGEALALAAPAHGGVMLLARGLEGLAFTVCAIAGPLLANLNASRAHLPLVVGLTATWIPVGQVGANLLSLPAVAQGLWRPLWWVGIALTVALAAWALVLRHDRRVTLDTRHGGGVAPAPSTRAERRALVLGGAIFGLWSGQYFAYMTWLPQYLVEVHGFGAANAVLAYTLPAGFVMIFCVLTGAVLRAGAPLVPLFVGSILVQTAVWFLIPATGGALLGGLSLVVYGVTAGITPVCLFAMPAAIMGPDRVAAGAFGVVMTGRNLGVLLGPVLLAQTVVMSADWHWVWPLFGGVTLTAALGAMVLGRRLGGLVAVQGTKR